MHTERSLYEPKLVELWKARFRRFETEEMARRFRQTKEEMKARGEARITDDAHTV
jgi:hypothetical protein